MVQMHAKSRRRYTVWISPDWVMTLMGNWRQYDRIVLPWLAKCQAPDGTLVALPEDYEIIDCTFDWMNRRIGLRITYPSFPEVPDGQMDPGLWLTQVEAKVLKIVPGEDEFQVVVVEE